MKAFFALCLLFVCVYSAPTFNAELNTSWNLFKGTYKKQYASAQEEVTRRLNWESSYAMISKHNLEAAAGRHNYTLKMNQFGDMTNKEFNQKMKGFKSSSKSELSAANPNLFRTSANVQLAGSIDWRKKGYVTIVKDQGECGSCWAFSATGALEGQHFAKTGKRVSLSEQNLVDCSRSYFNFGCSGGNMNSAFQYISDNGGIDTESSYPYTGSDGNCQYNSKRVGATDTGYVNIQSQSEGDLQTAIATIGPISVGIDASNPSFQFYDSGVYNEPACSSTQLDHGVLAVGYGSQNGQQHYIVKNSWGTAWGQNGYILMSRNKNNQCGIATMASYPLV